MDAARKISWQPWCGPLVELRSVGEYEGSPVQLVCFVQQAIPSQVVVTAKGRVTARAALKVGDETRSYVDVCLWGRLSRVDLAVGDVLFLANMAIKTFRGRVEACTHRNSDVALLARCRHLLGPDGIQDVEGLADSCRAGPRVRQRLLAVLQWAASTQIVLLRLAEAAGECEPPPVSHVTRAANAGLPSLRLHGPTTVGGGVRGGDLASGGGGGGEAARWHLREGGKQEPTDGIHSDVRLTRVRVRSLAEAVGLLQQPAVVNCGAWVSQIILPNPGGLPAPDRWQDGVALMTSRGTTTKRGRAAMASLVAFGCSMCGSVSQPHRIEWPCECHLSLSRSGQHSKLAAARSMTWIYRPFWMQLWDETSQVWVLVKDDIATRLFGDITATDFREAGQRRDRGGAAFAMVPQYRVTRQAADHQAHKQVQVQKSVLQEDDADAEALLRHCLEKVEMRSDGPVQAKSNPLTENPYQIGIDDGGFAGFVGKNFSSRARA
eukprot:jgi/Mesen1/5907/ME000030S05173